MGAAARAQIAFGKVIKGDRVAVGSRVKLSQVGCHSPEDEAGGEQPVVLVHKNGDVVESIEVICTCGKTIKTYLDYGEERT